MPTDDDGAGSYYTGFCPSYDDDEAHISNLADYNYVVVELIVNDATIKANITAYERWVELHYLHVNGQNGPINISVGQGFSADWGSSEGSYAVVEWGGALGSGSAGVGTNDARGFSCQSVGSGWVRIIVTGPGGNGPDDRQETETVNCTVPAPGNVPWLDIEPCVNGNRFDLEWGSASYASDYLVQRRAWSGGSWQNLVHTSSTHFETYEAWDTDWYFRVTPRNSEGVYGPSITEFGGNCPGYPDVDIRANNQQSLTIPWNTAATLSWTSSNASSCWANGGPWSGNKSLSGSEGTGNLTSTQTYTLRCRNNSSGYEDQDSVTITVQLPPVPTVDLLCNSAQTCGTLAYGTTRTLSWSVTNGVPVFTCSASNAWSGAKAQSGSEGTGAITTNRTWTIQCQGPAGWGNADSVSATIPAPTVDLDANGSDGPLSLPWNSSFTLSWSSTNAASCNASGSWSGAKALSGSQNVGPITTPNTYTYTLTCSGNGNGADSVQVTINPTIPVTSNVSVTLPDYCSVGPSATATWSYFDQAGGPQTAYQVQVDDNADYSSPIIDSGQVVSSSNAYTTSTGILQFNQTYRARVRTRNTFNQWSPWTNMSVCTGTGCNGGTSWTTPTHAYPNNRAPFQFTWDPQNPPEDNPVQFTDNTQYAPGSTNRAWSWTFVPAGGGSGSSTIQNPIYSFDTDGIYQVTQRVRDDAMPGGTYCTGPTQAINVQKPIPIWIEVAPR